MQRWMLAGTTALIAALPFLTLLVERFVMRSGIAPWYEFFVLYPPMGLAWIWVGLRLPHEAWAEMIAYFLLCATGMRFAAVVSVQQTLVALGAFYVLPMIGVFNRNWKMVALSVALGIGFDIVFLGIVPTMLHDKLGAAATAIVYIYGLLYLIFGGLNALVAHVLRQREETLLVERASARAQERRYRVLAENSADLIALHEPDGRIGYASPAWEALLGFPTAEVEGRALLEFCEPEEVGQVELSLRAAGAGRPSRVVHRLRKSNGEHIWCETLIRTVADPEEGTAPHLQSTSRDVTERKAFEEQLAHQASHDPLTEMPNRAFWLSQVDAALQRAHGSGGHIAVIFLDLDNFKTINDSMGHAAGDRILVAFAQRMRCLLPGDATLARLGGDEFAVLLQADWKTAESFADRIEADLRAPFALGEGQVYLTVSAGIVLSEPAHTSADELMRDADAAMYAAKRAGKAGHRRFDRQMFDQAAARLQLDSDLRLALDRDEFVLYYQPIVVLGTQRPAGFEALIRWRHPTLGLLAPDRFIPIAEENGLIVPIDHWVLEEACRQVRAWTVLHPADPPLFVSVNLSAQQFRSSDVAAIVRRVLGSTGATPAMLRLEITESALLVSGKESLRGFDELRQLGVRLVIDDFGTGYANLSYLQKFRVDALKIDRSFISRLAVDPEETAIVRSLLSLAKELRMDVTGEGIETPQQLDHLLNQECTYGQGYLFSRPVPAAEAFAYLTGWVSERS